MTPSPPRRLRVEVDTAPRPGPLRAAIASRLAGRTFPRGPEDAVAQAVADALRSARREENPWR